MARPTEPSAMPRETTLPSDALFSSACERNRQPMLEVLQRVLPAQGRGLEIASGSGQHVAWFAEHLPGWHWQPSDREAAHRRSIAHWCGGALAERVAPALALDVQAWPWPLAPDGRVDAILCANMLHIAPWPACAALMRGADAWLGGSGLLVLYGPYLEADVVTAASNLQFDAWLRARDPDSGLRALDAVVSEAARVGLRLRERVAMPANNLMLVFERGNA